MAYVAKITNTDISFEPLSAYINISSKDGPDGYSIPLELVCEIRGRKQFKKELESLARSLKKG